MIDIRQINVGKRKAAWTELSYCLHNEVNLMMVMIQEPNFRGNKIPSLPRGKIFSPDCTGPPRTCIYISNKLIDSCHPTMVTQLTNKDQTTVHLIINISGIKIDLLVSSLYMPGPSENGNRIISKELKDLIAFSKRENSGLIIGCDSNAHNVIWGSEATDIRGEQIMNFAIKNNLHLLNEGLVPTFDPPHNQSASFIDLTLCNNKIKNLVHSWRVNGSDSHSDHRSIDLEFGFEPPPPPPVINKKKTNWKKYLELTDELFKESPKQISSYADFERQAKNFCFKITDAYNRSHKKRTNSTNPKQPWMNDKILEERKKLRRVYRKLNKGSPSEKKKYKMMLDSYTKLCNNAKKANWFKFTENIESTKEAARLQKFFEGKNSAKRTTLLRSDGTYTKNYDETLEELLIHHFPDGIISDVNSVQDDNIHEPLTLSTEDLNDINECTTLDKIKWAINSFSPFKSPGEDGIFPALLQKASPKIQICLQNIFRASLKFSSVPKVWCKIIVAFIAKTSKESYSSASSFRPISLLSFLTKTLEKLLDKRLRRVDLRDKIDRQQHAYQEGKSTDSALHDLITYIEKSFRAKKVNLTMFIDLQGAFDNTLTDFIAKESKDRGIKPWITNWILQSLNQREVYAQHGACSKKIKPTRGVAQGSCISPLVFLNVADSLIKRLKEIGMHVVAFADDFCISTMNDSMTVNCSKMNQAMRIVEKWCLEAGLKVNPEKSQLVRFTRKTKNIGLQKIILFGKEMPLSKTVKYLGVILDSKLSMNAHLENLKNKASKTLWATKSMVSRTWGLKPYMMTWIYKQILTPRLLFGSICFWHRVSKSKKLQKILEQIQRLAMLMITGATKSTPTSALSVITNLPPLDIQIKGSAVACCNRLIKSKNWKPVAQSFGHAEIIKTYEKLKFTDDDAIDREWFVKQRFDTIINDRSNWQKDLETADATVWWCDGSVAQGRVGTGVYCPKLSTTKCIRLDDHSTIMQAEVLGISTCAEITKLLGYRLKHRRLLILSDSQAAIKAISRGIIESRMVKNCINALNDLENLNISVTVAWIPSHQGHLGNELADFLANQARLKENVDQSTPVPSSKWRTTLNDWVLKQANSRWTSSKNATFTKNFLPRYDIKTSNEIMKLNRKDLRIVTGFLTGHCCLNKFLYRIGRADSPQCRLCNDPQSNEDIKHFLLECPHTEILKLRLNIFGSRKILKNELINVKIQQILRFAKESGIDKTFFNES